MPTFSDARLNHLLEVLLQEPDPDGPYHQMLDAWGVSTFIDALSVLDANVEALKYELTGMNSENQVSKVTAIKLIEAHEYIDKVLFDTTDAWKTWSDSDFTSLLTLDNFMIWQYAPNEWEKPIPIPPPVPLLTTKATTPAHAQAHVQVLAPVQVLASAPAPV
jgi:hypothetical protein